MADTSQETHYASAAERHFRDADYLHDDGRLPTADHLYGFAAECASKSLMLRFTDVSMNPKKPGKPPAFKPWIPDPDTGKPVDLGHVPDLVAALPLLARGRSGPQLVAALHVLSVFGTWRVEDRYSDGSTVVDTVVADRRKAAHHVLSLHEQAVLNGRLP
ncbi:hypothetical protein [Streptomyces sp. NPDC005498]|uniref:hypothetical protein n=1 Tax=Streptomyces sp. NPDC005498 TaxID=3364717 RepID=UPI0036BD2D5A